MRYFLIDSENIQQYNFIDDLKLNLDDKIIMLISERSKKIRAEDLKRFTYCNAEIEFEDVYTGDKNAMDFQLIAHLALIISNNSIENYSYFVVSNDKDFNLPVQYLKNKTNANISILRTETSQTSSVVIDEVATTLDTSENLDYSNLNLDSDVISIIKKSTALNKLHNTLRDTYGNEKGRDLYLQIKPYYKSNRS